MTDGTTLTIATRAWMVPADPDPHPDPDAPTARPVGRRYTPRPDPFRTTWRRRVLIFDCETTIDPTQRLTFAAYRVARWRDDGSGDGPSLTIDEEGFVHADDLSERDPNGYANLRSFVRQHEPETTGFYRNRSLTLHPLRDFLDSVLWPALRDDWLIVGFNLPFDLSRLASDVHPATRKFQGGFSFALWRYVDPETGETRENRYRPRVRIAQIDSRRARMDIAQPRGKPNGYDGRPVMYRPGFLDLKTLAFALTDRGYSLALACGAFGVSDGKSDSGGHGIITEKYIAYARQDVAATAALLVALRADFDTHPIELDPCRAYSPASIVKAYYRAMGITPRLAAQPDFPPDILGYAMSAYYGGRAECAIRRTPVPIVYTDVLSMYPTVNANMGLWRLHTAQRIETEPCAADVRAMLASVSVERLCDPATWPAMTFYARIVPDGDVLPVRATYGKGGGTWNIGVNPFTDDQPHWYAGPDLVASVLLTGKVPTVLDAFRLVPKGRQSTLRPVSLRGTVPVHPAAGDFFRTVIEERKRAKSRTDLPAAERARLDRFLKVLANSGAYGVFVESNPQDLPVGKSVPVNIYGSDDTPFSATTPRPETPGVYSFPPVAALITAGARLVLALIERMVTDAGGAHAFCDTDSMAIVASEDGGLVACPGGTDRLPDGRDAVRALSWRAVDDIAARLATLNPYDRDAVLGSILKIEDVNFDPRTGDRRQVWCVSIAAKRYALFTLNADGEPTILPGTTRHGLGYLIDPRAKPEHDDAPDRTGDGDDDDPTGKPTVPVERTLDPWERTLWDGIVREHLGLAHEPPPWADRPAAMRHTVSTPWHLRAFQRFNARKPYADRIKPFNFMLSVSLAPLGRPDGIASAEPFQLVSAYESNPKRWTRCNWFDLYSGSPFRIAVRKPGMADGIAGVKSLGSVAHDYPWHPEAKRGGPDGEPCAKGTAGVLSRRAVRAAGQVCIGKEAHRLDDRSLVATLGEVMDVFADPRRATWERTILPRLESLVREPGGVETIAAKAGVSSRYLRDLTTGKRRGRSGVRARLAVVAGKMETPAVRVCLGCGASMVEKRTDAQTCDRCGARERKRRQREQPHAGRIEEDSRP